MKQLLVVWHSMTGGAHQMAAALAAGAAEEAGVATVQRGASEATAADLLAADAYAFVTPENLGTMAGGMKDFFDRIYYPALDRVNGRAYVALVCAGSDGTGAVRQLQRIATGLRLREAAPPLIVLTHAQTPAAILAPKQLSAADRARCHERGATLAAGLAAGIF